MKLHRFIFFIIFSFVVIATDVYIGTYTDTVYKYRLNEEGFLELLLEINSVGMNPSWLTIDNSHKEDMFLYTVNEVDDYEGQYSGSITALLIKDNNVTLLNR